MKQQDMPRRGLWVPFAAVIATAIIMWAVLALLSGTAFASTTYPPPPPTSTPPPPTTPTAHTGSDVQPQMAGIGVLLVAGTAVLFVARKRSKQFDSR